MWKYVRALRVFWPRQLSWRQALGVCCLIGMVAGAFCLGRGFQPSTTPGHSLADMFRPAAYDPRYTPVAQDPRAPVATIFGNVQITRQELGEDLIARFGPELIELLVNNKILECECARQNIRISDAEIEARLIKDLQDMKVVNLDQFVNVVLKKIGKTLRDYKQDVIRPQLQIDKLLASQIKVLDSEIKDAFEAKYGPKVQCRIIMFTAGQMERAAQDKIWNELNKDKDDSAFKKYAKDINPAQLAAHGGEVPPIHKHFGDRKIEEWAFSLRPGQISPLLDMPDGSSVILKCDDLIPEEKGHSIDDERGELRHDVYGRKLAAARPEFFKKLKEQAKPFIPLKREETDKSVTRAINAQLVKAAAEHSKVEPPPIPPGVNVKP